jgi:cyclopropane-fatty-acyl-phospholipid synthase
MTLATETGKQLPKLFNPERLSRLLPDAQLNIHLGQKQFRVGQASQTKPLEVKVNNSRLFKRMFSSGTLGVAESYIEGDWDCEDLSGLIEVFARNSKLPGNRFSHMSSLLRGQAQRLLRANSMVGSKRNIAAHYDLGNELFECFLDHSMMYSSAIYPQRGASLEEAQQHRLALICEKLQLSEETHLLEIGSGWGSLAIFAAQHHGCKVTTTTISEEQYALVCDRVEKLGLQQQITVLKKDYRLLEGQYDRLVSIEMIEAVGEKYLPGYFQSLKRLLKKDGLALLQCITIAEAYYPYYRNSTDFIREYIFPGGHLPTVSLVQNLASSQAKFQTLHFEEIGEHYAKTLEDWDERFQKNAHQLPQDKYDERFYRMWRFYFAYCIGGFRAKRIGTHQIVFRASE